jgi:hypothetical protein
MSAIRERPKCRAAILAKEWRPYVEPGRGWNGLTMVDKSGKRLTVSYPLRVQIRKMVSEEVWGPIRVDHPRWLAARNRPDHLDSGVKESRHYREQIFRDHLMPYIDPRTEKWDGRTRIDSEGNVSVVPRGLRTQMQLMVLVGYYGNVPWEHRAMRNFGNEGRFRLHMLLATIHLAMKG